jgi:short subunit dehydrogenase-like uncharacterized protein
MRKYDLILFGATGFTGRQAAVYLARHAPAGLRWAVAGRDRAKLESLGLPADVLVADSANQPAVDTLAAQTRVVASTAGPFARYGTPVVDACVRPGTDYTDITGETFWVESLVAQYHGVAATGRVRIVPCCGFDSVPSDLAAFLLARRHSASRVRAYFHISGGGLNGGTIASVSNMVASGHARGIARGDVLGPPHFDAWIGTWVGPFFMAPTNTWVVRRTVSLFESWGSPYPDGFSYHEYLKFAPPLSRIKAVSGTAAMALVGLSLRSPASFRILGAFLPKPGAGPPVSRMDAGWFSCEGLGEAASGNRGRVFIRNQGDAGNRSTVKMLCEAALCLANGTCTSRGGVLTPATAFGEHLIARLRTAGMTIDY